MLLNVDSALPILPLGPFDLNTFLCLLPPAPFHICEAPEKKWVLCSAMKQPRIVSSPGGYSVPMAPSWSISCSGPHAGGQPKAPALWPAAPGAEPAAAWVRFACSLRASCCSIVFCRMFSKTQQTVATGRAEIKPGAASQAVDSHRRCPGQRAWQALNSLDQELPRSEQRAAGAWLALMWRISSGYWYWRDSLLLGQTRAFDQLDHQLWPETESQPDSEKKHMPETPFLPLQRNYNDPTRKWRWD